MAVLAIDQGTSGTKALVVDDDGTVLAEANRTVRPTYLADGGVEIDPLELWRSVVEAGSEAVQRSGVRPTTVGLANQGETVLVWDRSSGAPKSMAMVWQDRRAQSVCDDVRALAPRVVALSGLQLDPYFSAPKMTWLRRNVTTEGVVTTTDSWLVHQMCGAFVTDMSTASRSLVMDLARGEWDYDLATVFELSASDLPAIVACDAVVGETNVFGVPMKVAGLVVDQAAALLDQGCVDAGMAKCTFGTGAFLLVNCGDRDVRSTSGLTTSVAWQVGAQRRYYMDGQVYAAGSALRWLQNVGILSSASQLDAEAAEDAAGVLSVPSLAGLAAPWWCPSATASFEGLRLSSERGHLIKAVLEGIAAQLAVITDAVASDLGAPVTTLKVDGGLTKSRRLLQSVADVAQIPVIVSGETDATASGTALLARIAEGTATYADASDTPGENSLVTPRWSLDRATDFRQRWSCAIRTEELT